MNTATNGDQQNLLVSKSTITLEASLRLIEAAQQASREAGLRNSLAVLDDGGNIRAFVRMDGASLTSGQVAINKAFTGLSGRPTHLWHAGVEGDDVLRAGARLQIPRMVTLGGGYPIVIDDAVVGGFGVSGGHYNQDMEVALEALRAIGAKHEW